MSKVADFIKAESKKVYGSVDNFIYMYETARAKKKSVGYFFRDDNLKGFGERKSEMKVLQNPKPRKNARFGSLATVIVEDCLGKKNECFVLSARQRNHPMGSRRVNHYFCVKTMNTVLPHENGEMVCQ